MKDVSNAVAYALLVPELMKAGREVGYAIAVHGTLARDLDIVAIPWTDDAVPAERLILHLLAEVDGRLRNGASQNVKTGEWVRGRASEPTPKPHGRAAWTIHCGSDGLHIDVSVMPVQRRREDVVAFIRDEAARMRERREGADEAVAAHFEILGDQLERGDHVRRTSDAPPEKRITVDKHDLGYRLNLPNVWRAGVLVNAEEAKDLTDALLSAQGRSTDYATDKVNCVDCGEPEYVEAVFCRSCETKNSAARGRNERRKALAEAVIACTEVRESFPSTGGLTGKWEGANACLKALERLLEPGQKRSVAPVTAVHCPVSHSGMCVAEPACEKRCKHRNVRPAGTEARRFVGYADVLECSVCGKTPETCRCTDSAKPQEPEGS